MKKRRVKKTPVIILCLIIITIIALLVIFLLPQNNKNKLIKSTTNNKIENNESKKVDNTKYDMKDGEQYISKTKTNMNLTKYNGAYYVDGIMIVNKSYALDSTYQPQDPYKEITNEYLYGPEYLDKTVMEKFLSVQKDASTLGYDLKISSGYRFYKVHVDFYNN